MVIGISAGGSVDCLQPVLPIVPTRIFSLQSGWFTMKTLLKSMPTSLYCVLSVSSPMSMGLFLSWAKLPIHHFQTWSAHSASISRFWQSAYAANPPDRIPYRAFSRDSFVDHADSAYVCRVSPRMSIRRLCFVCGATMWSGASKSSCSLDMPLILKHTRLTVFKWSSGSFSGLGGEVACNLFTGLARPRHFPLFSLIAIPGLSY